MQQSSWECRSCEEGAFLLSTINILVLQHLLENQSAAHLILGGNFCAAAVLFVVKMMAGAQQMQILLLRKATATEAQPR